MCCKGSISILPKSGAKGFEKRDISDENQRSHCTYAFFAVPINPRTILASWNFWARSRDPVAKMKKGHSVCSLHTSSLMSATTLNLNPLIQLTKEQFYTLCATNPEAKLELNAQGELIIMSPTGGETSAWNSELIAELVIWNRQTGLGKTFDSSGGFSLPNGAQRSPDAAWIPLEKWDALTAEEKRGFLPLCPDFVIELLSPSDSLPQGRKKMEEYRENGSHLGWLLEPKNKRVAIYRAQQAVEILEAPKFLSGEDVLDGFHLNIGKIWG